MKPVIAALCATVLVGCGHEDEPTMQPQTTQLATAPVTTPSLATTIDYNGTFVVGRDIAPGRWHTDGPRTRNAYVDGTAVAIPGDPCQWSKGQAEERDGELVVEGQPTNESGPRDIQINASDAAFTTAGCKPWHLVG
jgi:hypothetical protein